MKTTIKIKTITTILLLCISFICLAQEKPEYKIRDDGKDSVKISVLGNVINAFYTGQYIKRLNGDKGCHPHGKGKLKFIYDNDSAYYEGEFFEAKLTGTGYLKTKNFNYEGSLIDGLYEGKGVLSFEQSSSGEFLKVDGTFKAGKTNGNATIIYKVKKGFEYQGEAEYIGEVVNDKKFGKGIMLYRKNGDELDGNWDGELFTGKVYFTYSNDDKFKGNWVNSKRNGKGKYTWSNGSFYEGEWFDDKMNGNGKLVFADGSFYEGNWENNKQNGYGTKYRKFDDSYWKCNWKNDIPSDTGLVYSNNKDKIFSYKGGVGGKNINNSIFYYFEGYGSYNSKINFKENDVTFLYDSTYVGNFNEGLMYGKGNLKVEIYDEINTAETKLPIEVETYEGNWVKGKKQGKGNIEITRGTINTKYEGEWLNDFKNGTGVLVDSEDGSMAEFKGTWVNNKKDGFFEETLEFMNPEIEKMEQSSFKGNYKNDKRNGQGTEITNEGTYVGNWENDVKKGQGKMTYKNGKIYEGSWDDNMPFIEGKSTQANKTEQKGSFVSEEKIKVSESKSIKIGNQTWMTENLNVDKFRNGDPIPQAKTKEEWRKAGENKQPAWCYFNNNPANGNKYGKLYNWYAVNDSRGLAPLGWHIPDYFNELFDLIEFLGGKEIAGKKMKNIDGWAENGNGSNNFGFSALPGSSRSYLGYFSGEGSKCNTCGIGFSGAWWTSSGGEEANIISNTAYYFILSFSGANILDNYAYMEEGMSVRCVKD